MKQKRGLILVPGPFFVRAFVSESLALNIAVLTLVFPVTCRNNGELNYSVIIPHRNSVAFLRRAVESIPQRDDLEVLVVDNSTEVIDLSFLTGRTTLLSE